MGSGIYSGETTSQTNGVVPSTVTGLSVSVSSPNLVLNWNDASGGTPNSGYTYQLERSTSSGSGFSSLESNLTDSDHIDTTVNMGTTYYYRVKATNAAGQSASWSSEASGSVPLPTWTAKTDFPSNMRLAGCAGASGNSILFIAGNGLLSHIFSTSCHLWNGSSWTSKNTLSVGRSYNAGCGGSSSAASAVGGYITGWGKTGVLEQFDGTNWSSPSSGTDGAYANSCAAGQSTSSLIRYGGYDGTNTTSIWNGSGWSSSGNMSRAHWYGTGCGSGSSALETGGSQSGGVEFTATTEKFTSGTWSSAANNTAGTMKKGGSAGTSADIIIFGGFGIPSGSSSEGYHTVTNQYSSSGNSWSAKNSMPTGVWGGMTGNAGSTSSALWATASNSSQRQKVWQYG